MAVSPEVFQQRPRGRVALAMAQQQRVLTDRRVLVCRHHPARAFADASVFDYLRQRHETELGIAAGDELVGLRNVLALHEAWPQFLAQAQPVQRGHCRSAIGRRLWIGHGQVTEIAAGQDLALRVDVPLAGRPQHQGADGVGEAAAGHADAVVLQPQRGAVIGGQQHVEGAPLWICA